ncbi:single-stranded DNA-binding protein [Paractinoplanes ferrugineus]|uniref:Single-stranded DNA-binding protein n=1 Tax=Paractinoplanes ferrugineus TaxID=113564 RepID=A0A919MED3_9ACTN|nr:single-stranded DNA-binding protein [Actinoplanes ferrugineus]GIE16756.1 single-stranded DNA-binding protein [Actinoplanes ferrugineus]
MLPTIHGTARLVDDPEIRFTPNGKAVAKVRLAFSDRKKNETTNQWEDGNKAFLEASVWNDEAEHIAESLQRGMEVLVSGKLRQREYQTREGEKRVVFEIAFATIAPTLRYATAKVQKMARSGGNGGGQQQPSGGDFDDPWSTNGPGRQAAVAGDDSPPF